MYSGIRHLLTLVLAATVLFVSVPARAWVETSIESDWVTVDVERDGRAVVSHELMIKVRGGPLEGFDVAGVDADAEPLPDAVVSEANSGGAATALTPLLLHKQEDGGLRIEIDGKGVKRGTYLFKFGYRTNLLARMRHEGALVELSWVGPRLDAGVDSARVVFKLPAASPPPRLPDIDPEQAALGLEDDPGGVFVSNLRRGPGKDELEVIRPHVAKGEPVVWRIWASPQAFGAFTPPEPVAPPSEPAAEVEPRRRMAVIGGLAGLMLLYALMVMLKWRGVVRAAELRRATPAALVPLPSALRAALAGAAFAGAVAVGALTVYPTLAGGLLVLAIALAAVKSPRPEPAPRGPGRWLPLSEDEAFSRRGPALPGRWLDAGSLPGFVIFALLLAGAGAGAVLLLPVSPYHALMLALGSAAALPIFCTGRAGELPADPVGEPRKLLSWLGKKLARDAAFKKIVPWARIPDQATDPDELRLLVQPVAPLQGLIALEVAVEYHHGNGGPVALPCVVVRARDGSASYAALPRSVVWSRGRKPEERVAVIRPKLPTRQMCLSLLRRVGSMVSEQRGQPGRSSNSASRSGGRRSSTAKPRVSSSPAQAA